MGRITFMMLGALLWLGAAAPGWGETPKTGGTLPTAPPKEQGMFVDGLRPIADSTIPPIDRAVPPIFETASFGLG